MRKQWLIKQEEKEMMQWEYNVTRIQVIDYKEIQQDTIQIIINDFRIYKIEMMNDMIVIVKLREMII